jgi:hypothetical protein
MDASEVSQAKKTADGICRFWIIKTSYGRIATKSDVVSE